MCSRVGTGSQVSQQQKEKQGDGRISRAGSDSNSDNILQVWKTTSSLWAQEGMIGPDCPRPSRDRSWSRGQCRGHPGRGGRTPQRVRGQGLSRRP